MVDPVTPQRGFAIPLRGSDVGTWDVPVNGNMSLLDNILSGTFIQALTNTDVTLTTPQADNFQIVLQGALTANVNLIFPAIGGVWVINNQATGNFSVTMKTSAGGSVGVIVPSGISQVGLDGTNAFFLANPAFNNVGKVYEYSGLFLPANHAWANGGVVSRADNPNLLAKTTAVTTANMNATTTLSGIPVDLSQVGVVGAAIEGAGIPAGTTITAITTSTITLSQAATATTAGVPIQIFPYGNGDGATTFNVIDKRERVGIGRGNMGGAPDPGVVTTATIPNGPTNLASEGGAETHVLTVAELAEHNHALTDPGHRHAYTLPSNAGAAGGINAVSGSSLTQAETTGPSTTGITLADAGSNTAHLNMQPTIVCNYIVQL